MDYLAALAAHPLVECGITDDGLREYETDLFRDEPAELGVYAYAFTAEELTATVLPQLHDVLGRLEGLLGIVGDVDADLATVSIYKGRVGLGLWSRGVNNEFTAIFEREGDDYRFLGFDDLFAVL